MTKELIGKKAKINASEEELFSIGIADSHIYCGAEVTIIEFEADEKGEDWYRISDESGMCEQNGWCFSVPEKYLDIQ